MKNSINFNDLLISDCSEEFEFFSHKGEIEPYIKWLAIDLALESKESVTNVKVYGDAQPATVIGRLFGALILGTQASRDGLDFVMLCDDTDADLFVAANNLEQEGLLEDINGECPNVFYIHSFELSRNTIESSNIVQLFDLIPRVVFQCTNVLPQICCNTIATIDGYYEEAAKKTRFDPRSVNKFSIELFKKCGYMESYLGELLYTTYDDMPKDTVHKNLALPAEASYDASFAEDENAGFLFFDKEIQAKAERALEEDRITIGTATNIIHAPATMPDDLMNSLRASLIAHELGTGIDYAKRMYASKIKPSIPELHRAFQKMYFAGKLHIDETMRRMYPRLEPTRGEVYSDAALSRARNTYYVAAWLYREGHLIEAHTVSRLMLEQIAWSFVVYSTGSLEAAKQVKPAKAITLLKKKIPPVGRMYNAFSNYVHLPLSGHPEFMDLSSGATMSIFQFGEYSYVNGKVISFLADYWAAVYEYTQARHFEQLENWKSSSSDLELDPNRPFLKKIKPLRTELERIYTDKHGSLASFIEEHWDIDLE